MNLRGTECQYLTLLLKGKVPVVKRYENNGVSELAIFNLLAFIMVTAVQSSREDEQVPSHLISKVKSNGLVSELAGQNMVP